MKKIILLVLFSMMLSGVYAQVSSSDSVAYQLQRKKINTMLAQRKVKFGEYDKSLTEHTGIFGMQTKKDIRNSNDILMDIVKTDDQIFVQLKVLMDYSAFKQKQVITHTVETETNNLAYMASINKLQAENAKLKADAQADYSAQQKKSQTVMIIVVGLIVIVLLLLRAKYIKKDK